VADFYQTHPADFSQWYHPHVNPVSFSSIPAVYPQHLYLSPWENPDSRQSNPRAFLLTTMLIHWFGLCCRSLPKVIHILFVPMFIRPEISIKIDTQLFTTSCLLTICFVICFFTIYCFNCICAKSMVVIMQNSLYNQPSTSSADANKPAQCI